MTNNWQPIKTIPNNTAIDLFIKSTLNPKYGRRSTHIAYTGGVFYGKGVPESKYGEYASHWMYIPEPPKD